MCEFGETVLFHYQNLPSNTGKSDLRWDFGIWLGRCTLSDSHFVGTGTTVYRTRTVKRLPKPGRYRKELLPQIQATPWNRFVGTARARPTPGFVLDLPAGTTSADSAAQTEDLGATTIDDDAPTHDGDVQAPTDPSAAASVPTAQTPAASSTAPTGQGIRRPA